VLEAHSLLEELHSWELYNLEQEQHDVGVVRNLAEVARSWGEVVRKSESESELELEELQVLVHVLQL
jgi:hypothetical protein